MSDGESSHHSNSSLDVSISLPFEVKVEAATSQPGSEVTLHIIISFYKVDHVMVL